jgi:aldose 1-epimerase
MRDALTLACGDARVDLAPAVGGAVLSFAWRGLDVLRPTPAVALAEGNVRLCASFPLVPYSNRIDDARLAFAGATYTLHRNAPGHPNAIHGVGFERPWRIVEARADSAVLGFDYVPALDPLRAWPFAFRAHQRLAVSAQDGVAALRMTLAIENTGRHPCPFGLGWHPYFPRSASTLLGFRHDGMWETGPTLLPARHVPAADAPRFDPPCAIGATTLDNVFTGVAGAVQIDDAQRGLRTTIAGDSATPFLVVYIPADRDFLAVEPVTHMTDAFNRHARGERDTGTRLLAPGAAFSCTMRIMAQALPTPAA